MKTAKQKRGKIWKLVKPVCCLLIAASCCILSASQLKDISIKSETNKDTISLTISSKTKYTIFRVSEPNRLVIELNDCEYATAKKNITENTQFIKNLRGAQYKETPVKKSRIVVDLNKAVSYSAKSTNGEILVELTEKKSKNNASAVKPSAAKTADVKKSTDTAKPAAKTKTPAKNKPKNTGAVKSTTDAAKTTAAQPEKKASEEKPAAKAPAVVPPTVPLTTAHDVTAPPVQSTETAKPKTVNRVKPNIPDKKHQELVKDLKTKEKTETKTSKKPETKKEDPKKAAAEDMTKTGTLPKDPVTLDFTDADIKDVLQILAVKTGMNIIYSDDVAGTLSLHLENVPFNEAMNLILQMKGLVLQQVASNVLRVMTPATLTKERADSVQVTQIFRLSYSKAPDISSKLSSVMTAENQKITVQTDERTNSVIVTSTPEGLIATAALINKLDVKPEQVLIEAKIVEITVGNTRDLGIEWNVASGDINAGDKSGIGTSASDAVDYGATPDGQREPNNPLNRGTGVAAPPQSSVGSFTFGYLKSDLLLTARLAAAQSKGDAKILSQPRIATLNNMEAKIVVGDQIPYAQTTVTTAGSTQSTSFMTVGIQLTVTPTINADGRITMKVTPVVSYATRITAIGPQVSTRQADTTVLVKNGETIVIGGMITDQERKDISQVPILGDLPVLGHFFKSQHNEKTKTELLVFVTPYIMKE